MARQRDRAEFIALLAEFTGKSVRDVMDPARELLRHGSTMAQYTEMRHRGALTSQQAARESALIDMIIDLARAAGVKEVQFAIDDQLAIVLVIGNKMLPVPTSNRAVWREMAHEA